jgi:hypothetical protein
VRPFWRVRESCSRSMAGQTTVARASRYWAPSPAGPHAITQHTREATMRLAVMHQDKAAAGQFAREIAAAGTAGRQEPRVGGRRPALRLHRAGPSRSAGRAQTQSQDCHEATPDTPGLWPQRHQGDISNMGLIARRPEYLPVLKAKSRPSASPHGWPIWSRVRSRATSCRASTP